MVVINQSKNYFKALNQDWEEEDEDCNDNCKEEKNKLEQNYYVTVFYLKKIRTIINLI